MPCNSRQYHPDFGAGIAQIVYQRHTGVWPPVAVDQRADAEILGKNYPPVGYRFSQSMIARVCPPPADLQDVVTSCPHRAHGLRDDVGVREEAHSIRRRRYDPLRQRHR